MPEGDKASLLNKVATELPDNNEGEIEPSNVRTSESAMITYNLNMEELSTQTVKGPVIFDQLQLSGGAPVEEAPEDGVYYVRGDAAWVRKASLVAISNAVIPINDSAVNPSFFVIDDVSQSVGITLEDGATGTVKNSTGRDISEMVGSISFQPDVTGGTIRRMVIVSETSADNLTWLGNLNSIRKVEIGTSSESFKTNVSLVDNWAAGSYLRFRAYDEADGGLDLTPTSATILGQSFTGPSLIWSLVES
jgi:hypothetical protein